jgi:hypothetical protein
VADEDEVENSRLAPRPLPNRRGTAKIDFGADAIAPPWSSVTSEEKWGHIG